MSGEIPTNTGFDPQTITGAGGILVSGTGSVTVDGSSLYVAVTPGNWAGNPPTTVQDAIERLAAAVAGLLGNPIP
jgi:hypothetical protein